MDRNFIYLYTEKSMGNSTVDIVIKRGCTFNCQSLRKLLMNFNLLPLIPILAHYINIEIDGICQKLLQGQ